MIAELAATATEPNPDASPWYADHRNLAWLAEWLIEEYGPAFDVVRFLEKPRKWTPEYESMKAGTLVHSD